MEKIYIFKNSELSDKAMIADRIMAHQSAICKRIAVFAMISGICIGVQYASNKILKAENSKLREKLRDLQQENGE